MNVCSCCLFSVSPSYFVFALRSFRHMQLSFGLELAFKIWKNKSLSSSPSLPSTVCLQAPLAFPVLAIILFPPSSSTHRRRARCREVCSPSLRLVGRRWYGINLNSLEQEMLHNYLGELQLEHKARGLGLLNPGVPCERLRQVVAAYAPLDRESRTCPTRKGTYGSARNLYIRWNDSCSNVEAGNVVRSNAAMQTNRRLLGGLE